MHSTVSVLLLINKKSIFYKKILLAIRIFWFLALLTYCPRLWDQETIQRSWGRVKGTGWPAGRASLSRAEEREEWPCIRAGLGRLALCPPAQQPAPPNAASQVSPRTQSKETKHRQSQSCCPPQSTWLEWVTTALYQLPLCSCLLSDKVDWDTQHRIPLLSNCI